MPTFSFLDFLAENIAIKSTYSVHKSSKLPPREQKSTWHFSRYHFIGMYSYAGNILVTKEELITEVLNDSHDYGLSWQNILEHRRNLLVGMCMSGLFSCFSRRYAGLLLHLCSRESGNGQQQKDHSSERENEIRENSVAREKYFMLYISCALLFRTLASHYPSSFSLLNHLY